MSKYAKNERNKRYLKNRRLKNQAKKNRNVDKNKQDQINEIKYANKIRNYDRALVLLEDYLQEYPDDIYMLIFKASIYNKVLEYDKQEEILKSVLSRKLNNRELSFARMTYARFLKTEKKFDEAVELYEKLLNESSDMELIARRDLTELCIYKKYYQKALKYLYIDGYNDQYLNNLRCKIYMNIGNDKRALKELDSEYIDNGTYVVNEKFDDEIVNQDTNYLRGHIYFRNKDFQTALIYLEKALSVNYRREYYLSLIDVAKIRTMMGQSDIAISLCEDALKSVKGDKKIIRGIKKVLAVAHKSNNNFEKAMKLFEEDDEHRLDSLEKANIYFSHGEFEEAEKTLVISPPNAIGIIDYREYLKAASIKYRLGKYEEASHYINELFNYTDKLKKYNYYYVARRLKVMIDKELNCLNNDKEYLLYSEMQTINYDEKKAIDHIIDHHIINESFSSFNDSINIEDLFYEVKSRLDEALVFYSDTFDRYVLKYDSIGYDDKITINQLEVITIPNTRNIITMYPSKNIPNFDLEEEDKEIKRPVKRLSQIDKFKLKYGNLE